MLRHLFYWFAYKYNMNDIFINYDKLKKELDGILNEIKKLYINSPDIKRMLDLYNKSKKYQKKINEIKPFYYKEKMKNCNHLFIKVSHKHFDNKLSDKYILFVDHYCLKCGCLTKKINKEILKKNNICIPSLYVSHNEQINIIESSKNYAILDFKEADLDELILKWEILKRENRALRFNDLVELFKNSVDVKDINNEGEKIYEFKYI